jgi:hypothetical protein
MADDFRKGDLVSWKAGRGEMRGPVERVITKREKIGGRSVPGSAEDPRYLVRNEATGKTSVKTAAALTAVAASSAPERSRRLLPVLAAVGAVALIVVAAFLLLRSEDELSHDDYATEAEPALTQVEGAMGAVVKGFPETLSGGDPVKWNIGKFRHHVQGMQRTLDAALEGDRRTYAQATAAVKKARTALDESTPALTGEGEELDDEAQESADIASDYVDECNAFLDSYDEVISYFEARLAIDEKRLAVGDDDADFPDFDPGDIQATIDALRESTLQHAAEFRKIQAEYEALKPPAGLEKVHAGLNEIAALDLARAQNTADSAGNLDPAAGGVISFVGQDDENLAAYRDVQAKLAAVPLNESLTELDVLAAALTSQLKHD